MNSTEMMTGPARMVERLRQAVNAHDPDALVDCFAETYRNETPVHPSRGFEGHAQVRANWERIFAGVPDVSADVVRVASSADVVWSEWEMGGTRGDGAPHLMRGVVIFGVADERATWARFYLEPVELSGDSVDDAIVKAVGGQAPR